MHFHLHASKAFSLTLTADIYFLAVGTAGGGRAVTGVAGQKWGAGGSKYTPQHRPAPPAPAPVEIARAESSAAQKQV